MSEVDSRGRLIVVGTPIGNLGDLSPRARAALADADLILAEDTRRTRKLLSHAGVSARLQSFHRGNETRRLQGAVERLERGEVIALVSDSGMPLISDPGEELVAACIDRAIPMECVPGPSAALVALILSGFAVGRFVFEGFLPRNSRARRKCLESLLDEGRTITLFESPHRLPEMLSDAAKILGEERRCAICRELTKLHEEVWRGTLGEAARHWRSGQAKGEFVVVIEGHPDLVSASTRLDEAKTLIASELESGKTPRQAALIGESIGLARSSAYRLALELANARQSKDPN